LGNAKKYNSAEVSERVLNLLQVKNLTRYRLAQNIGITEQSISKNMSGKSNWGVESLLRISEYFNVSIEWLIYGKETPAHTGNMHLIKESDGIEVPLYGMAICGLPASDWSEPKGFISVDFVRGLQNVFAVKATGMSMAQTIMPDDIVFAYRGQGKPKDKSIVLVSMRTVPDSKEGLIKRIKWLDKKQVMLYSDNSRNYDPIIVSENDIYEIFAVHNQIIRQLRQPGQKIVI